VSDLGNYRIGAVAKSLFDRSAPQSPTKMPGRSEWIPPHLAGQQRRPLGELGVVPEGRGHGDNWEAKRPRGF
jgi:hypothetical protein